MKEQRRKPNQKKSNYLGSPKQPKPLSLEWFLMQTYRKVSKTLSILKQTYQMSSAELLCYVSSYQGFYNRDNLKINRIFELLSLGGLCYQQWWLRSSVMSFFFYQLNPSKQWSCVQLVQLNPAYIWEHGRLLTDYLCFRTVRRKLFGVGYNNLFFPSYLPQFPINISLTDMRRNKLQSVMKFRSKFLF